MTQSNVIDYKTLAKKHFDKTWKSLVQVHFDFELAQYLVRRGILKFRKIKRKNDTTVYEFKLS